MRRLSEDYIMKLKLLVLGFILIFGVAMPDIKAAVFGNTENSKTIEKIGLERRNKVIPLLKSMGLGAMALYASLWAMHKAHYCHRYALETNNGGQRYFNGLEMTTEWYGDHSEGYMREYPLCGYASAILGVCALYLLVLKPTMYVFNEFMRDPENVRATKALEGGKHDSNQ